MCFCDEGGTSWKTQAKVAHCAAFGIKQSQVPAIVLDDNTGNPVLHGVVERCYNRFRACIQHYCINKQEDMYECSMTIRSSVIYAEYQQSTGAVAAYAIGLCAGLIATDQNLSIIYTTVVS